MFIDGFVHQLPDIDPARDRGVARSLDAVIDVEGRSRAHYLLARLMERAREQGRRRARRWCTTDYINTIPPEQEPWFPGDEYIERRIRAFIRWNAVAMVDRANHRFDGLGGHLSTYASAAALYEVGFNHFFRGKGDGGYGDQVFFQGHAAPGIYARAFLEGRLTEEQLDRFRREVDGGGLPSYPHPRRMPTFWEFPTVSMGLGPLNAVYQARFNRYLLQPRDRRHVAGAKVWCFVGDGEMDEPESTAALVARGARAARQPDLRRQLQPAAPRRSGARQRQGDPGARVDRSAARAGTSIKVDLGPRVGRPARARRRRRARQQDEHAPSTASSRSTRSSRARTSASTSSVPTRGCARWSSTSPTTSCASCRAAATTTASSTRPTRPRSSTRAAPTVILAKTVKGWTLGADFEARNATHQIKKMTADRAEGVPRPALPRDPRRRARRRRAALLPPGLPTRPSTST